MGAIIYSAGHHDSIDPTIAALIIFVAVLLTGFFVWNNKETN